MIDFNPLVVLLYGSFVGVITGLIGAGGGTLVVPFLNLYLGLPIRLAIGTSLFQVTGIAASGAYQHFKLGTSDLRIAAVLSLSGMIMAYFGAMAAHSIPDSLLKGLFGVFVVVLAVRFMRPGKKAAPGPSSRTPQKAILTRATTGPGRSGAGFFSRFLSIGMITNGTIAGGYSGPGLSYEVKVPEVLLLGGAVGFVSGLLGVAGGFILVPGLVYLGIPMKMAVGTSLAQFVASATAGTVTYYRLDAVDVFIGLLLMTGGIAGTVVGTKLNSRLPSSTLRKIFGLLMIPLGLLMVKSALGY